MKGYLLDTNICVYLLRGNDNIVNAIEKVGWLSCCISEITVAELVYGAECSRHVERNKDIVYDLCEHLRIIPISPCIDEFAQQKARLRKLGLLIEDSDLWIGVTSVVNNFIMVTENVKHLGRIDGIKIENWNASAEVANL